MVIDDGHRDVRDEAICLGEGASRGLGVGCFSDRAV